MLIADPGPPVAEFVPYLRRMAFRDLERVTNYNDQLAIEYNGVVTGALLLALAESSTSSDESRRVVIVSLLALVIGETLLRFRVVAAMKSAGTLGSLLRGVWWGVRYFIPVTIHIWLLRCVGLVFGVVFIIVPVVMMQFIAEPLPTWAGDSLAVVNLPAVVLVFALVNSLCAAFASVYDARLYLALTERSRTAGNSPTPFLVVTASSR